MLSRMYGDSENYAPPNTILSSGNVLLLQGDLLSKIKPVPIEIPFSGMTLQVKGGLLWYEDKIFVPENLRVSAITITMPLA